MAVQTHGAHGPPTSASSGRLALLIFAAIYLLFAVEEARSAEPIRDDVAFRDTNVGGGRVVDNVSGARVRGPL